MDFSVLIWLIIVIVVAMVILKIVLKISKIVITGVIIVLFIIFAILFLTYQGVIDFSDTTEYLGSNLVGEGTDEQQDDETIESIKKEEGGS